MQFAWWVAKATNTHSDYVTPTAFSRQKWLRERTSMLSYTCIACLVNLDNRLDALPASYRSQFRRHRYTKFRKLRGRHSRTGRFGVERILWTQLRIKLIVTGSPPRSLVTMPTELSSAFTFCCLACPCFVITLFHNGIIVEFLCGIRAIIENKMEILIFSGNEYWYNLHLKTLHIVYFDYTHFGRIWCSFVRLK
jgi:hypothetical protein